MLFLVKARVHLVCVAICLIEPSILTQQINLFSSQMGLMASMYDIAAVIFSPFVGYVGGSRRKPVWCGCGLFAIGIGFVIFLLPHLIIGNYHTGMCVLRHDVRVLFAFEVK